MLFPLTTTHLLFFTLTILLLAPTYTQQQQQAPKDCWTARATAQNENDFVLECTSDGNYKPLQCDKKTGYCFCVNELTGKPKLGISGKIKTTSNCSEVSRARSHHEQRPYPKPAYHHGAPSYLNGRPSMLQAGFPSGDPTAAGNKARRSKSERHSCNTSQRVSQLNFLLGLFKTSMDSRSITSMVPLKASSPVQSSNNQNRPPPWFPLGLKRSRRSASYPVEWKFGKLDLNADGQLNSEEFFHLVEASKDALKTLIGCANTLAPFCDSNRDGGISRAEFTVCFEPANAQQLQRSMKRARKKSRLNDEANKQPSSQATYASLQPAPPPPTPSHPSPSSSSTPISYSSILLQNPVNSQTANKNESRLDCLVTRSNLMEATKANEFGSAARQRKGGRSSAGGGTVTSFIPKCTADGYYEQVQCLPDLQFCWCVNRVTGQTIKSIKTNSTTLSPSPSQCEGIRKGCDQRRRVKFHAQLRSVLMRDNLSCDTVFGRIDANHDLAIDAGEWKKFKKHRRTQILTRHRKCFHTEIAYCDQNGDDTLSHGEWLRCCNNEVNHSNRQVEESLGGSSQAANRQPRPRYPVSVAGSSPLTASASTSSASSGLNIHNFKINKPPPRGKNPFTGILKS